MRTVNHVFQSALIRLNQIKRRTHIIYVVLSLLRSLGIAILVMSLWNDVVPHRPLINVIIAVVTFVGIARFSSLWRTHLISLESLLMNLDMQYPLTNPSPFTAAYTEGDVGEWGLRLNREEKRLWAWEQRRMTTHAGSLMVSLILALLMFYKSPADLKVAFGDAKIVVSALTGGTTLEVLSGIPASKGKTNGNATFTLSTIMPPEIELLPENMVRLTIVRVDNRGPAPAIKLLAEDQSDALTLQMSPSSGAQQGSNVWSAEFSVSKSSDLIVPSASQKKLAHIKVLAPPTPKVQLSIAGESKDPWPDQDLLPLKISANATFPLNKIALQITSRGKKSRESVLTISGDTLHVETDYKLNLLPWMEEDSMEFDIIAEASDRSEGGGLTGFSNPIHIKVASAYGRYREALDTLRQIKSMVDESRSSGKPADPKILESATKAQRQSDETPFFDNLDRMEIARIAQDVANINNDGRPAKLAAISDDLGKFLLEHETLDDRERDRDFFIAIRTLSRAIERTHDGKNPEAKYIRERMTTFLDERHKRWAARVERLGPAHEPTSWKNIHQHRPFHTRLNATNSQTTERAHSELSALASEYRAWIEELEAREDAARAKQEQERQQGVANARNELREIQQRQDQISTNLDRAQEIPPGDIATKWSASRPLSNSNIKQSKGLLQKLKSLAPNAGERLERAIEAMEQTSSSAESNQWAQAEQSADTAGRLLRDADQAASKSQKNQERGRRRRTGGDDYHGNAIGGQVEIKRQYEVNPKYRENILEEIENETSSSEDKILLDNWLRQVVR